MRKPGRLARIVTALATVSVLALSGDRRANAAAEPKIDKNYDLAGLDVFRKTIVQIKDNYVDPSRIDPKEMFTASLEAVERQVPEVMVEVGGPACDDKAPPSKEPGTTLTGPTNGAPQGGILESGRTTASGCAHATSNLPQGTVRVTVGNAAKDFEYKDIDSIWQIPLKMHEVFTFVKQNLVTVGDEREIEYAAVNGMLATLDPHSWLLKPDVYKEMKVQTRGEFGGLGFVISMIDDKLTVRKVLKNTPAAKGGVKKGDVITQIDSDSTVSMELQEAVDHMRGKPGTKVTLYVQHKGAELKKLDMTRALVTYETVVSKLLDNGIGYVRLSGFSGTTTRDMMSAIKAMKAQNGGTLKGLVMDLRGNPGGLLEQAIQVSDAFVDEGTIVTTVGMNGTLREPKLARADGGEKEFPMAVLISNESASASEIVAGALKNLNRAVIVGRQSFGKGSVQVLYDFPDRDRGEESALKLTIAQYLTPGDMSIQEVGITPDIELVPSRIIKDRIDLFSPPKTFREADYDKHFANGFAHDEEQARAGRERAGQKPSETLRFLKEETAKEKKNRETLEAGNTPTDEELVDDDPSDDDGVQVDYQIEFCRDLLLHATSTDRQQQLAQAKPFVEQRRAGEQEKVKKVLEGMGVNWAAAPATAPKGQAHVQAEIRVPRTQAGNTMDFAVTAHNVGTTPIYRLRAFTKVDNGALDRREFVFGQLLPGEKRTWTVPIKVPRYVPSRRDDIALKWEDDTGDTIDDSHAESDLTELPRPAFAWSFQVNSADGLLHNKGDSTEVTVDVKNVGTGLAYDAYAALHNLAEDKINVRKGRTKLGQLKPGETKSATFVIEVKKQLDDAVPVRLEVGDKDLYEAQRDKLQLPAGAAIQGAAGSGMVRVGVDTAVLASAQESGMKLASVKKGTVFTTTGKAGPFWRVEWEKGRSGFLPVAAGHEASAKVALKGVSQMMQSEPPVIKLANVDTARGGLEIDGDHLAISGNAIDVNGMRDLQIFVQHENDYRKVFFRTSRKAGQTQTTNGPTQLDFQTDLQLKPGNSTVVIIAREDDDLQTQRTLVVHRKQPVVAQQAPPHAER
jgi:carboxyl-terminal processing protease